MAKTMCGYAGFMTKIQVLFTSAAKKKIGNYRN